MKGSVSLRTDKKHPYWRVCWPVSGNRSVKISHYLGESEPMYQRHPDKKRDIGYQKAQNLLALMQGDEIRAIIERAVTESSACGRTR